jgi:hypothetical protein
MSRQERLYRIFPFLADGAEGEGGMLSLASLFVLLGFLLLFSLLSNVGRTVTRKLETQNAADAVAASSGNELARGLNSITAANHLIGELQALCVIHHGFGGDELDGLSSAQRTPYDIQESLQVSYSLAAALSAAGGIRPVQAEYNAVRQEPRTGAAIRDSRLRLKQVMTWAYIAHAVGGIFVDLSWIPYVGPILRGFGMLTEAAALTIETKVYQEWLTLDGLELLARGLMPVKRLLQSVVIPGCYLYTRPGILLDAPVKAEQAARDVSRRHNTEGWLFPGATIQPSLPLLHLPVTSEPQTLRHPERSQLVRASSPWIQYWRVPILRFGEDALLLSRFRHFYHARTDEFTLLLAKRQKESGVHVNLLILDDLDQDGQDKGQEPWTKRNGSARADELFSTIGFAHRPRHAMNSSPLFRQSNPDGLVAYAQVMLYNANPQPTTRPAAQQQPVVGHDTLNWDNAVPEAANPGYNANTNVSPIPSIAEPKIRINWRARLVPTTRLGAKVVGQPEDVGTRVLRGIPLIPGLDSVGRTH